ncbi:MAG: hypothetical protein OSB00_18670 [Sphingomonas bacterium]|nr:hypothetical protein [Sphingomonas bacterium]
MLAGLIIAVHDAADRPGTLTATLPFGGVTLIEYQARLLIAAGAAQIVILVGRLTPELMGAINRIGRRGVTIDTVRSPVEALERLHPLSRVLLFADGLSTTPDAVAVMAREGGDALLVVDEDVRGGSFARIGGGLAWAGIARLDPERVAELAALPRDYDMEQTLVRLASQAHAAHVPLPERALSEGHGIDHRGAMLVEWGRQALAAAVSGGRTWFDRLIVAPLARLVVPLAVPRAIPVMAIAAGASALALGALIALWFGRIGAGMIVATIATIIFMLAAKLAFLRDEPRSRALLDNISLGLPALAVLLDGHAASVIMGDSGARIIGIALVTAGAFAERAATESGDLWWRGSPPAYLTVAALCALAGAPILGLGIAAIYAAATLFFEIELLRR